MKTYKVLEAHQGDKAYAAGDTRIADPNAVGHLVTLGLLEETGDAAEPAKEVPAHETKIADLEGQVSTLTAERDDARAALSTLAHERDHARAETAAAQKERDDARGELKQAQDDLAAERAKRDDTPPGRPAATTKKGNN